ncbi:porin [Alteromonas sp.]|jgi:hypothetical protein|uniref:porin n=1 Tax=Alteromonas sp. TaxID=232 RepID=UPI0005097B59|nr:porin [Alteromonas sp.]MAI38738.1 porin [Alteromonas sp.]OUX85264.1 MAG: porin [Alteromonas sp. TMED35]|tara:strand:+ start:32872 stop:34101 length:1230 start_codon:yes stop_codon:yes gene_type:complete
MKHKIFARSLLSIAVISTVSGNVYAEEPNYSWNISGWINEGLTYYDDGEGSDVAQLSDNGTTLGSRITLSGNYSLEEQGLDVGFEVIVEPLSGTPNFAGGGQQTPLLFANQDNLDTFNGGDIGLLGSSLYIGGDWGKVTVGLQSMPTDNIAVLADPSGTIWSGISVLFRANGFFIRGVDDSSTNGTWGQFAQCLATPGLGIGIDCNGIYRNGVRYDLPQFGDFSVAVGYANDEIYDIAVKYSAEHDGIKTNVNAGYSVNKDGGANVGGNSSSTLQMQAGLMHIKSGFFGVATYQMEEAEDAIAGSGDDTDAYYFKAGIRKQFNRFGDSAFYAEYASYNDQYGMAHLDGVTGSQLTQWGVAAEQYFSSRFLIYGKYENLSLDIEGSSNAQALYNSAEDLTLFMLGGTLFF